MNRITTIALLALAWLGTAVETRAEWQGDFSSLLQRHVQAGGVDYRGWAGNRADMDLLWEVVGSIAMEAPSGTRNQRLAWYLNAYNALVLHKMLVAYPWNKQPTDWRDRFLTTKDLIVAGAKVSLDDLEHRIIGPTFKDPRVHFALNRASMSCSPLRNRAYTAGTLNADLNAVTRSFLSENPNGVRISLDGKHAEVSAIFDWFRDEFDHGDLRTFINRYREQPIAPDASISFLAYNWDRNDLR